MERKILKASAGTGKTYRLALEYAAALLKGEKIRDIVIMTFTKKAAAEIKDRIIDFMKELSQGKEEIAENIQNLYPEKFPSKNEIIKKSEKIYKEIILNRDTLKIFTIDGLKNLIFKTAIAPMMNINSYDIIDDSGNEEYLKKCFERIFRNKKDFDILKNFLEANVERSADKYVEIIKNIVDERWKSLLIKEAYGKNLERKNYEIKGILNHLDRSLEILQDICDKKGKAGENIKNFIKKDYYSYLDKTTQEEKEKFIYDNWSMIFDKEIKNGSKTKTTKALDLTEENEELAEIYEELLKELVGRIYNDTLIPYEKEIFSFLERIYNVYDEIKFRERKFTHNDITNYTLEYINDERLNLADEKGITDYMREILESRVTTVFIDEFQDTSVVQWKIFMSMVKSADKVICVGDEKQSIYGWRGGDKKLFVNLAGITEGKEEYLDTSYRSCKNIVEFTNEFFEKYSQCAKGENIYWDFEKVKSSKKEDKGYIEIADNSDDEEAVFQKTAEIIKGKFGGNYRGIGILARNNSTLDKMAETLSENKIPYFLETNLDIFSHRTAVPVVKFLKYLVSDNIFYLAEFLRDDIILIDDKSLKELLIYRDDFEKFEFSNKNLNKILENIKNIKIEFENGKLKLSGLIEEIIKRFGIVKKYSGESDIQNIYNFIDSVKKFDDIREFLKEIEENRSSSEYMQSSIEMKNAVILMSIHKSKGLEFDTVFYIHKENSSRAETGVQFNICMSEDYKTVKDYMIVNSSFEKILKYLENSYDYAEDKKKRREEEEINNLYVALTRPKNNLFIMLNKMKKEKSFMRDIIFENYLSEAEKTWSIGEIVLSEKIDDTVSEKSSDKIKDFVLDFSEAVYNEEGIEENIKNLQEEERKYSSEREEKREAGTVVHFFLENLIHNSFEEREKAFKMTVSKYGASFEKENLERILKGRGIEKFLEDNKIIFSEKWDIIYPEYSIYSEKENKLFRLDRVMIQKASEKQKGKILVVDYKTGGFEESQLENYKSLIEQELKRINQLENYDIEGEYLQIEI